MSVFFDHLAIQVEGRNLENTVKWYADFFECKKNWQQSSDFQQLTLDRIPGIQTIVELESSYFRFHLFSKKILGRAFYENIQYHHIGFAAKSSNILDGFRKRWIRLQESKKYYFFKNTYVTEKIIDSLGVESLYFTDVNGLEYELTYIPTAYKTTRIYPNEKK